MSGPIDPGSTLDRPWIAPGSAARPRIEPGERKASHNLPKSTEVGRKRRFGTDSGPILVDCGSFLIDFLSILVPKLLLKPFRRSARRRLLFDAVFDDVFDRCCALFRRTAFPPTSLGHWFLPSQTRCRHVRRLPLRRHFFRKARSNRNSISAAIWMESQPKIA